MNDPNEQGQVVKVSTRAVIPPVPVPPGTTCVQPLRQHRPLWPLVMGSVSMVIGATQILTFPFAFLGPCCSSLPLLVMPIVLIGGGLALIQRKELGRKLHVGWACVTILCSIAPFGGLAAANLFGNKWDKIDAAIGVSTWIVLGLTNALYPIFVTIWMRQRFVGRDLRKW